MHLYTSSKRDSRLLGLQQIITNKNTTLNENGYDEPSHEEMKTGVGSSAIETPHI